MHPELARRGVSQFSCFDDEGLSIDERMAQFGHSDIDPAIATTLEPIFDMSASCLRTFDHEKFQRDGYWVWDGIWLPEAQKKLIAAIHNASRLNDMWTEGYRELGDDVLSGVPNPDAEHDYLGWENVDWEGLGYDQPPAYRTPEEIERIKGGGQLGAGPPPGTGYRGHQNKNRVPIMKGYGPEGFVAGYEPYIMFCLTHPQMMAVHKLMLGPEIRHDHNTLLLRKEGFPGQNWHSHAHHEGATPAKGKDFAAFEGTLPEAGKDVISIPPKQNDLGLVRTLIYPEGYTARGDGGVKIVPGGVRPQAILDWTGTSLTDCLWFQHLERCVNLNDPVSWVTEDSLGGDEAFREGWLQGKKHRITGEPLDILCVDLPPGSMVSAAAHMPHGVEHRAMGRGTRLCTLFAYAKPDPEGLLVRSPERRAGGYAVSPEVLEAACAGKILTVRPGPKNFFTMH